eukprot:Tbor_TRINITY_DN5509_c4_g1::TRINITY_DN5509_c4_g1_i1::g.13317::m.13317
MIQSTFGIRDDTYVVQIFSTLAPSHINPLLLRLHESATAADAIRATLSKLALLYSSLPRTDLRSVSSEVRVRDQIQTLSLNSVTALPSDLVEEYTLWRAEGDGQQCPNLPPFDLSEILKSETSVPFILYLSFNSKHLRDTHEDSKLHSVKCNGGSDDHVIAVSLRNKINLLPHISNLSSNVKAVLEERRREIELKRASNVLLIERVRKEKEMSSYRYCLQRELCRKQELERVRLENSSEGDRKERKWKVFEEFSRENSMEDADLHAKDLQDRYDIGYLLDRKREKEEIDRLRQRELMSRLNDNYRGLRISNDFNNVIEDLDRKVTTDEYATSLTLHEQQKANLPHTDPTRHTIIHTIEQQRDERRRLVKNKAVMQTVLKNESKLRKELERRRVERRKGGKHSPLDTSALDRKIPEREVNGIDEYVLESEPSAICEQSPQNGTYQDRIGTIEKEDLPCDEIHDPSIYNEDKTITPGSCLSPEEERTKLHTLMERERLVNERIMNKGRRLSFIKDGNVCY